MTSSDKRKSPRIPLTSPYAIVHQEIANKIVKDIVVSKNFSVNGFCFKASHNFKTNSTLLISFKNQNVKELNTKNTIRVGDYFLARVQWCTPSTASDEIEKFDIGCRFLEKIESDVHLLKNLTQFVNHLTLQEMDNI